MVRVVALGGDGTGPEVLRHGLQVLQAVEEWSGLTFEVESIECGGQYYLKHGRDWPEGSEQRCQEADVILLGAVGWPAPDGSGPVTMDNGKMAGWSPVIGNRIRLDLYANIRPVKLYPGVKQRIHGKPQSVWQADKVDMVILRENTEDLYSGIGGTLSPGGVAKVAVDTRVITREASEKVIRKAFEVCRGRTRGAPKDGKKRLTAVVKDNVLMGCKLFAQVFREVGQEYPEIEQETAIVDAFTQWLIGQPEHYDVVVTTNMFGDIVTDLASVLQGGMGMAVGCNVGDQHAMFEPIHGSAPKYSGLDKVNPLAMILSVKEALAWLAGRPQFASHSQPLSEAAEALEKAVCRVLEEGQVLTYDLVGEERASSGTQVTAAVIGHLKSMLGVARTAKSR